MHHTVQEDDDDDGGDGREDLDEDVLLPAVELKIECGEENQKIGQPREELRKGGPLLLLRIYYIHIYIYISVLKNIEN